MAEAEPQFPDTLPGAPTCSLEASYDYNPGTGQYQANFFCRRPGCLFNQMGVLPALTDGTVTASETSSAPASIDQAKRLITPHVIQLATTINRRCLQQKAMAN